MESKLIGRKVNIPDFNGNFSGDWGTIIDYDGEYYSVAFADDMNNVLIFERNEFKVIRNK